METQSKSLTPDALLTLRDAVYPIALYSSDMEFDKDHAYLDGDYFYLYRGTKSKDDMIKPGIYTELETGKIVKVEPVTEEEKEYYNTEGKVDVYDEAKATELINTNDDLFIPIGENCKLFNPQITLKDDILKRLLKLLFIEKEIDIDNYKDRFPDKNALFNFKQVMKNEDARVTMKIFERACDVVNVEYIITVREKPNGYIGKQIGHDITVSSEDTYDYGTIVEGTQETATQDEE